MRYLIHRSFLPIIVINVLSLLYSCHNTHKEESYNKSDYVDFSGDSAYMHIKRQISFGPRVPNTKNHSDCAKYLVQKLSDYKADTIIQRVKIPAYNGKLLDLQNIIGRYNVDNKNRILLFAHWDSRPFADRDENIDKQNIPIEGADDGASGVAVLLEIARLVSNKKINIGIDIIFFDGEDYGPPYSLESPPEGDWWCLGSQYWAKNPHISNYHAKFGVLLDMVGSQDATFFKEKFSMQYADAEVESIWQQARKLGYGKHFKDIRSGGIIDDHLYVNSITKIASVDIIHIDSTTPHGFGKHWHTHKDNLDIIDPSTLVAVGSTLLHVIELTASKYN